MKIMYRIGYIGFGGMAGGYHYGTAMRDDVPFTPTAVFDVDPAARANAESKGLKAFDNLKDFLDSRLFDFVLVATPNQFHCPYVCAALEAGYHAMSEKPVAMNVAELEKMIATSKKTGKMFTVHQNRRWDRDVLIVKEALAKGYIGKPLTFEGRIQGRDDGGQMFGWRLFADHGGGMFGDWGIHVLDQTLFLIDEPVKSVYASIRRLHSVDCDDISKLMITFESGLIAEVEACNYSPYPLPKWLITGDRGGIRVPECCCDSGTVRYMEKFHTEPCDATVYPNGIIGKRTYDRFIVDEWKEIDIPENPLPQDWAALYKNVAGALDGTEQLVVTPESVLRCFKVLEAARISAQTGDSVRL